MDIVDPKPLESLCIQLVKAVEPGETAGQSPGFVDIDAQNNPKRRACRRRANRPMSACGTAMIDVDIPFRGDSKPCDFKGEGAGVVSM
ncbi:hypothetical protein [Burkholderia sp. BCC0419]|uniref:hypothetical protein n=1 Tax=Burkholderia sp. BCC0419 TaxID=486878 RepID=UPI0015892D7D|nr:hypothetical protein [Burkholderia sp. BCC0419]